MRRIIFVAVLAFFGIQPIYALDKPCEWTQRAQVSGEYSGGRIMVPKSPGVSDEPRLVLDLKKVSGSEFGNLDILEEYKYKPIPFSVRLSKVTLYPATMNSSATLVTVVLAGCSNDDPKHTSIRVESLIINFSDHELYRRWQEVFAQAQKLLWERRGADSVPEIILY